MRVRVRVRVWVRVRVRVRVRVWFRGRVRAHTLDAAAVSALVGGAFGDLEASGGGAAGAVGRSTPLGTQSGGSTSRESLRACQLGRVV